MGGEVVHEQRDLLLAVLVPELLQELLELRDVHGLIEDPVMLQTLLLRN